MEVPGRRLLFLVLYTTVVAGILCSTMYILFSVYNIRPINSVSWLDATSLYRMSASSPLNALRKEIWHPPPSGTPFPPLESFKLSKEFFNKVAKDDTIVVTFGNYAFLDFILNWVEHLTRLGVYNLAIGALDKKVLEALYWKGLPVFNMGSDLMPNDVGWGSAGFGKIGREKVLLLNTLLPFGYKVLLCDTDTVWLKNPLPYFAQFPEADVLTSSDQLGPTVTDERLEVWTEAAGFNIGIFYWRPTGPAMKLAKVWRELLLANDNLWDQAGFINLLQNKIGPSVEGDEGLVYAFDGSVKLGILPVSIFCSGHTYFVQAMAEQLKLDPYAVHATFQYSGTEGKRHRMREAMLFLDPPEYYDVPGGFLSFKLSIPKNIFLHGEHSVETHFSLVNYQLKRIRTALAVASLLNRTLVMPPIWCRLDKFWFGHPGILPETLTKQPFVCPMDHVFQVNVMLNDLPEETYGPRIDFREYSFLKNPLLPSKVKDSMVGVQVCDSTSSNCTRNKPGVIGFPNNGNDEKLLQVLSSFKDVKLIQFSSMDLNFPGFTDKARDEKFRKRVKKYTGEWCCLQKSPYKGHIYYDIYWDEKPGWKPKPPQNAEDDHHPLK